MQNSTKFHWQAVDDVVLYSKTLQCTDTSNVHRIVRYIHVIRPTRGSITCIFTLSSAQRRIARRQQLCVCVDSRLAVLSLTVELLSRTPRRWTVVSSQLIFNKLWLPFP